MKKEILVIAMFGLAALAAGCARVAPNMISTDVYSSSRDAIVANDKVVEARAKSAKENERMALETAELWNKLAKKELESMLNPATETSEGKPVSKNYTVGPNGVVGGLPCLFNNDSQRNKTLILTKYGGLLSEYKFKFDVVKQGGQRKYNLLPGNYYVAWTVEYDNNVYTGNPMEVTLNPKLYDDRNGEQFYGGYRLWGY